MNKNQQRQIIKQRLSDCKPQYFIDCSKQICEKLIDLLKKEQYQYVLSYKAMSKEVDLQLVHQYLLSNQVSIAYPVVEGDIICFYQTEQFEKGSYGILEPIKGSKPIDESKVDCILVPLVGFDEKRNRLGHGKGYYDRFLLNSKAKKIGVGFEIQKLDDVIIEENDIALDAIVTEKEIY